MLLFGDAKNPSNSFYEALARNGFIAMPVSFNGGYGWPDLPKLITRCDG